MYCYVPMHPMYQPPMYRRRDCAPCFNPLALFLLFLFAPCLLRTALFLLAPLLHVGFALLLLGLTSSLCSEACSKTEGVPSTRSPDTCRTNLRACFSKMAAAAKQSSSSCAAKKTCASEDGDAAAKGEAPLRKRDLSSVRFEDTSEGSRVIVVCPGVAANELDVSITPDGDMHIHGATARGGEVFAVDRRMTISRNLEPESAECNHANGVLTVTLKRKAGKRIAVNVEAVTPPPAREDVARGEGAPEQAESEGEWVEPAAKPAAAKKAE